jgi:hypothetical protein
VAALVGRPSYPLDRPPDVAGRGVQSRSSSFYEKWFSKLPPFSEDKA